MAISSCSSIMVLSERPFLRSGGDGGRYEADCELARSAIFIDNKSVGGQTDTTIACQGEVRMMLITGSACKNAKRETTGVG
jgi:hypothetical protein